MNRSLWIASLTTLVLFGLGISLPVLVSSRSGQAGAPGARISGDRGPLAAFDRGRTPRPPAASAVSAAARTIPGGSKPAEDPARSDLSRFSAPTGGGAIAPAAGRGASAAEPSASSGDGTTVEAALAGTGPLRGARLTAALEDALEEGDLATLQGLLLSELTMDGTEFGADDLPALFDALVEVDDYGLQNLLLTHLDRIDVPAEEKVSGYLDYLQGSEKPMHSDAVFKKLVELGGDETLHGLSEIVRNAEDGSLRKQAAGALGSLRDARAVPTLEDALRAANDPRDARPYAQALAAIGDAGAISSLVDYVSRSGNEAALSAIMSVKDPAAAQILAESLGGRVSEAYEKTALRKLQSLADPSSLRDLGRYLGRASEPMARMAVSAVSRIRDPQAPRILEDYAARARDPKLADYALRAAKRLRAKLAEAPREKTRPWKDPNGTKKDRKAAREKKETRGRAKKPRRG